MTLFHLDNETFTKLGLVISEKRINASLAPDAKIYQFRNLDNVYIMESDLYGNSMPEGSVFLAFEGRSGLIGTNITIEKLQSSSENDIKKIVEDNHNG